MLPQSVLASGASAPAVPGSAPAGTAAYGSPQAHGASGFDEILCGVEGAVASPQSSEGSEALIGIDEVQKALNRSRASVYRYTNTDPRNLNPPFNPRKLNPEYRSDQKDPLLFHPNEVARFARDVLRIKEVTVEVLNSPSTATQQLLGAILDELRSIRGQLEQLDRYGDAVTRLDPLAQQGRPAA